MITKTASESIHPQYKTTKKGIEFLSLCEELIAGVSKPEKDRYQERFIQLINLIPDPVIIVDQKGHILNINKHTEDYGFKNEQLVGKNFKDIPNIRMQDKKEMLKRLIRLQEGERNDPMEFRITLPTGENIYATVNSDIIEYDGKPAILSVLRVRVPRP